MKTIELAMAMDRLGTEYAIISKALKDMIKLAELDEGTILICAGLQEWLENPPSEQDILSGEQPFPLDAIRKHVELCPSCAIVSELWDKLLRQHEYELELTRKLLEGITFSVEGFEVPAYLRTRDAMESYATWYKLTDEELDFYAIQFPIEIQPILRNREEMKRLLELK